MTNFFARAVRATLRAATFCRHEVMHTVVDGGPTTKVVWCMSCGAIKSGSGSWLLPDAAIGLGVRPAYPEPPK